jgi:hypothetical protein
MKYLGQTFAFEPDENGYRIFLDSGEECGYSLGSLADANNTAREIARSRA